MRLFEEKDLAKIPLPRLIELAEYLRSIGYDVTVISDESLKKNRKAWVKAIIGAEMDTASSPFTTSWDGTIIKKAPRKSVRVQRILDKKAKKGQA